jgi:hypothetical protein
MQQLYSSRRRLLWIEIKQFFIYFFTLVWELDCQTRYVQIRTCNLCLQHNWHIYSLQLQEQFWWMFISFSKSVLSHHNQCVCAFTQCSSPVGHWAQVACSLHALFYIRHENDITYVSLIQIHNILKWLMWWTLDSSVVTYVLYFIDPVFEFQPIDYPSWRSWFYSTPSQ